MRDSSSASQSASPPEGQSARATSELPPTEALQLRITIDVPGGMMRFEWFQTAGSAGRVLALGRLRPAKSSVFIWNVLEWELEHQGRREFDRCQSVPASVTALLRRIGKRFPSTNVPELGFILDAPAGPFESGRFYSVESKADLGWLKLMGRIIRNWAISVETTLARSDLSPQETGRTTLRHLVQMTVAMPTPGPPPAEQSRRENVGQPAAIRTGAQAPGREKPRAKARPFEPGPKPADKPSRSVPKSGQSQQPAPDRSGPPRAPVPTVPVRFEFPELSFQECALPLASLKGWRLTEQALRWWTSNQSDDLLALPYCRIQKLDYQVRTALRVVGALRGRALLSDEVGLGKTIEAGLVLKEWLTRGMVKRFLVLTVPSLVDQWEEELSDKFDLAVVTTNQWVARSNPERFWRDNLGIVASLHTLKQPAHLAVARDVHWDLVIVDEAHYLRNRESQAWQAVNALPRHFLLLLTATPVQNSLEELYNLVTLLQPGQLPTPKEFRARFFDPKKPRQPREPEELRRLLGQVMIRNTRASSGVNLPPRRAETILFEPDAEERGFWQSWEAALRIELARLPAGQASLWGRLLLQAAGSSPAAWHAALEKFPNSAAVTEWRRRAPLDASWRRKVDLLPPLTRVEGGLVLFTQFLDTQAALAEALRAAQVEVFVVNGSTPPAQRQPITEEFRKRGGALILTHSGTEGRNLQFCHRLVNFDLPWNPMEIEQRIGRLHRLGQQHPVRIYNLVQAGTLQEHLLEILQEKLNLFELVVGETGLVLGERFGSDEFADEVLRRWRESEGRVGEAMQALGDELAAARDAYNEVKQLDETLFAQDYETT